MFRLLADATFATHAVFVALAIPSTLLALTGVYRNLPLLWLAHNLSMLVMAIGRMSLGRCPLVSLEIELRSLADQPMPYTGSFVSYCLEQLAGTPMPPGSMLYISSSVALLSLVAIVVHKPFPFIRLDGSAAVTRA